MRDPQSILRTLKTQEERFPSEPKLIPDITGTIDARVILKQIHNPGEFYWAGEDGTPLVNLAFNNPRVDIENYLAQRNEYSKKQSKYPWGHSKCGALQRARPAKGQTRVGKTSYAFISEHKTLWDKRNHGRNREKTGAHGTLLCQVCNRGTDNQEHVLLDCPGAFQDQLRKTTFAELHKIARAGPEEMRAYLQGFIRWAEESSQDDHRGNARTGALMGRPLDIDLVSINSRIPDPNGLIPYKQQAGVLKTIETMRTTFMQYSMDAWRMNWILRSTPDREPFTQGEVPTMAEIAGLLSLKFVSPGAHLRIENQMASYYPTVPTGRNKNQRRTPADRRRQPLLQQTLSFGQETQPTKVARTTPATQRAKEGATRQPPNPAAKRLKNNAGKSKSVGVNQIPSWARRVNTEVTTQGPELPQGQRGAVNNCQPSKEDAVPPLPPTLSPLPVEHISQDVAPSPQSPPEEAPCSTLPRVNPSRYARPPQGSTIDLVIHSDSTTVGLIPEHLHQSLRDQGALHGQTRKTPDYADTWVAESYWCPGGALGFFFGIPAGRMMQGGTLLGIYFGPDTAHHAGLPLDKRKEEYNTAIARWTDYDNVLAYQPAQYVVRGDPLCGPARANDGFANTNSILTYSRLDKRMEVRTNAPMHGGSKGAVFESLVNYDIPQAKPSYWTADRIATLPEEARQQCLELYSKEKKRSHTGKGDGDEQKAKRIHTNAPTRAPTRATQRQDTVVSATQDHAGQSEATTEQGRRTVTSAQHETNNEEDNSHKPQTRQRAAPLQGRRVQSKKRRRDCCVTAQQAQQEAEGESPANWRRVMTLDEAAEDERVLMDEIEDMFPVSTWHGEEEPSMEWQEEDASSSLTGIASRDRMMEHTAEVEADEQRLVQEMTALTNPRGDKSTRREPEADRHERDTEKSPLNSGRPPFGDG